MKNKTVIVGLSGGVDSSVSALLLKEQGYNVIGVTMQNWEIENDDPYCTAEEDLSIARAVCDHLKIPFQIVNFSKEYWEHVFQYALDEFSAGRTPNPDVLCNQEIKFKAFLNYALAQGADYLATGHYVQIQEHHGHFELLKGSDPNKDQSYFLYTLNQNILSRTLFPVGHLEKIVVRQIAQKAGLLNYAKKDSTGICFIGERKFKKFLEEYLLAKPGPMKTPEGKTIGQHDGLMFYTLGQRQGLKIGGVHGADEQPWYVVNKDLKNNVLEVAQGHDHPLLFSPKLTCDQLTWIAEKPPELPWSGWAKTRYRQSDQRCHLIAIDGKNNQVDFEVPQRAITPGQSVVFYEGNKCLGGGIITHSI